MHDDNESRKEKCTTMREMGVLNWQEMKERCAARIRGRQEEGEMHSEYKTKIIGRRNAQQR